VGTPAEVYDRPSDRFVASFVGSPGMNFIPGEIASANGRGLFVAAQGPFRVDLPLERRDRSASASATLGIRCEHIHEDAQGSLVGRVITEEYLGNARNLHVDTPCGRLIVRTGPAATHTLGAEVRLRLDPAQISIFEGSMEARL
jgi:ABC-type sugar transport system ATPase subunit